MTSGRLAPVAAIKPTQTAVMVFLPMPAVGNLGGFIGPYVIGVLLSQTHSFALPCVMMGVCLAISGILVALMPFVLGLPPGMAGSKARR